MNGYPSLRKPTVVPVNLCSSATLEEKPCDVWALHPGFCLHIHWNVSYGFTLCYACTYLWMPWSEDWCVHSSSMKQYLKLLQNRLLC